MVAKESHAALKGKRVHSGREMIVVVKASYLHISVKKHAHMKKEICLTSNCEKNVILNRKTTKVC